MERDYFIIDDNVQGSQYAAQWQKFRIAGLYGTSISHVPENFSGWYSRDVAEKIVQTLNVAWKAGHISEGPLPTVKT